MSVQSKFVPSSTTQFPVPQTAMILDDCDFDRAMIRRLNSRLENPLQLEEVPNIEAMNNCMNTKSFDLIMIDYGLGKENGLAALDVIQQHDAHRNTAKIMITGNSDAQVVISAMKRGCNDFVYKRELTPQTFQRSVREALLSASTKISASIPNLLNDTGAKNAIQIAMKLALQDSRIRQTLLDAIQSAKSDEEIPSVFDHYDENDLRMHALMTEFLEADNFVFK